MTDITTHHTFIVSKPANRITSDIMTLYEYTEVVSIRAAQIEKGAIVYVNIDGLTDPVKMAEREIEQKKCPLSIQRKLNQTLIELCPVNDLAIPSNSL